MKTLLTLAACLMATTAFADAGMMKTKLRMEHRSGKVTAAYWYPAEGGGKNVSFGENGVFHGTPVLKNAPIAAGKYPVVLMSHGLGGNIRVLSWLAAGLAERGAIVVAVNHPDSTTRDFDLRRGLDHGTRARDLSVALDLMQENETLSPHMDMEQVMATGFSYGGWTALSLGGVRGDLAGYADHCEKVGAGSTHCRDIAQGGVDLRHLDPVLWGASYMDARVTAVAAIDPGLIYGLAAEGVVDVVENMQLIALGDGVDRLVATDFDTSGFADLVEGATTLHIVPANHHTALLRCKPKGAIILEDEGDDPVCDDPQGTNRGAVHDQIVDAIAAQLDLPAR